MAKSSKAYDTRAEANPGEPRAGHFNDAVHQATFAAVIKSRKTDQDALTFPEPPGDD